MHQGATSMGTHIQEIIQAYTSKGVRKGDELLLPISPIELTASFLHDLHALGVVILGIDYWYTHNGFIVEDLSSADFSEFYDRDDAVDFTYQKALQFIHVCPKNIDFVSFVF
jgi:hypothetical protein